MVRDPGGLAMHVGDGWRSLIAGDMLVSGCLDIVWPRVHVLPTPYQAWLDLGGSEAAREETHPVP